MQSDNTFVVLNNYSIVVAHFYFSSTLEKALLRLIKSKALPRTVLSWIFQRNQSTHPDLLVRQESKALWIHKSVVLQAPVEKGRAT